MQTQRDHVHAHQFQMGRMSSALVLGDPTSAENPSHRAMIGLIVGTILALLLGGGFAVYGWLVPGGNDAWKASGAIIVEKETGNRYVYLGGYLRPVLNLTSAMLIEGSSSAIKLTSQNSLKGVPHGSPVGLSGAPQSVPSGTSLVTGPWLACLAGSVSGAQNAGVGINFDPAAPSSGLAADKFALVSSGGVDYVIWRDHKLRIGDSTVAVALGVTNADPIPAPAGWLDQLPSGDDLVTPAIPGAGEDGLEVAGHVYPVGQVFGQSGTDQLFVLRRNGLAAIDQTAYELLQGTSGAPVQLSAAQVASAPRSDDKSLTTLLPAFGTAKWQDPDGLVLCQRQAPVSAQAVGSSVVFTDRAHAAVAANGTAAVDVAPGTGAIVYPVPLPANTSTPVPYLITDEGISYQLADADAISALKFSSGSMVPFPKQLLSSIRSGPALSRKAIDLTEGGLTS